MAAIAPDATHLVGGTPLVRINRLAEAAAPGAQVVAKLEFFNPANSVKDRVGVAIVDAAQRSGQLKPGGTIVEATSGNTGIALAWVGAVRGYHVVLTLPESASQERRVLPLALGAELVLTPGEDGMAGAVAAAEEIAATRPHAILASQFSNPANPQIHRETTADEIWRDTDGAVDILVAGVGTGGTITGVGQALKARNPDIRICAVQPAESPILTGGTPAPHGIEGIGPNFLPDNLDRAILDEVISVPEDLAIDTARAAARREGLLVGLSAGAALAAACTIAQRPDSAGKMIVVIVPSCGERDLSSALYHDC
ncbi:MAG: cysteine synthase A [Micrococcales bacterium]|nr:cysteine synthase A [Micrococcales bacterium]